MAAVIGITTAHNLAEDSFFCRKVYIRAVNEAGGVSLLLPPAESSTIIENYASLIDGLLLSGGGDIHPVYFGEEPHWRLDEVSPERDRFEIELLHMVLKRQKPVLAICRGIQLLNVALGGTLYQDLEQQLPGSIQHQQRAPRCYPTHQVRVAEQSLLAKVLGNTSLRVNSLHHQAVRETAPGLQATAWTSDGVIEGLEGLGNSLVLGVQWHPEAMCEESSHAALFQALVRAAAEARSMGA